VFKKLFIAIAAALFAACAAPSGGASSQAPDKSLVESAAVTIKGIAFDPKVMEVRAGESVTWTNEDDVQHTVTSGLPQKQGVPGVSEGKPSRPDGAFDGELDGAGSTFETTIDEPGTYPYFCEVHSGMQGELRVTSPK
jgi:plastocyanin